jgi:NADP-dependent 3-hydroxy acid dehydrogenase YdfG
MFQGIENKVVVIAGASSGLRKATARQLAIGPDAFARAVAFAINEPDDVDINEILFRPTAQPV